MAKLRFLGSFGFCLVYTTDSPCKIWPSRPIQCYLCYYNIIHNVFYAYILFKCIALSPPKTTALATHCLTYSDNGYIRCRIVVCNPSIYMHACNFLHSFNYHQYRNHSCIHRTIPLFYISMTMKLGMMIFLFALL